MDFSFTLILEGIAVLGIMGAVFGALLAFAAKIFHVEVDPKQEAVRKSRSILLTFFSAPARRTVIRV